MPESTKVPTSHSTLPPASAVALRREVCDNALLLAADGPDISNQFGEIHIQNLREIGYAEEKHEILGRFYVPWSKMGTPSRFLTLCVDDRSQSREGLIILNWYLFFRDGYRGFEHIRVLSGGISAATATLDERRVLLKFSMTDETSGRPKLTIHEMPETETDNR